MLSLHEIENFLQHTPAPLQDIVFELRNIIVKAAPDAMEVIRWGGLSYFHEGRGGLISAGIARSASMRITSGWRSSMEPSCTILITCSQAHKRQNDISGSLLLKRHPGRTYSN